MKEPSPVKEEKTFFQWVGTVLGFLLSLVRRAPLLVVAIAVVLFFRYYQAPKEPEPRFREPGGEGFALTPAGPPSPEMGPVFRCVQGGKAGRKKAYGFGYGEVAAAFAF